MLYNCMGHFHNKHLKVLFKVGQAQWFLALRNGTAQPGDQMPHTQKSFSYLLKEKKVSI